MSKPQQQAALLAGLVTVMIVVYARAFGPRGGSGHSQDAPQPSGADAPAASTAPSQQAQSVPAAQAEVLERRKIQRERAGRVGWRRDPFTRGMARGQIGGFTLSGILWDAASPIAIINGQILRAGEEIDGFRVIKIAQDRVSLTDEIETFDLLISP